MLAKILELVAQLPYGPLVLLICTLAILSAGTPLVLVVRWQIRIQSALGVLTEDRDRLERLEDAVQVLSVDFASFESEGKVIHGDLERRVERLEDRG